MNKLILSELTIEQKIGQMLFCRQPIDQEDKDFMIELIRRRSLGGVHIWDPEKTPVNEFLEAADYPLLIGENMEYGFEHGAVNFPCPLAIASTNSTETAYESARIIAENAREAGYNIAFGPVMDLAMNPLSSCVGPRSYGENKELVAGMTASVIDGFQEQGVIVTAKHYPGFGESSVDSHLGMVYLTQNEEDLINRELYPYIENVADLSGIMVGHIMVPKVDPEYPASLSSKLISIIRRLGYKGLLITDSLAMVGLTNHFGLEECHSLSMKAGNDMLLASYRIPAKQTYSYMLATYKNGLVSEQQINAAVSRIIEAQNKTLKTCRHDDDVETLIQKSEKMSEKSIASILTGVNKAEIPVDKRYLFVVQEANKFVNPVTNEMEEEKSGLQGIEKLIADNFINSDIVKINDFPSTSQMEYVVNMTMSYESIVLIVYNKTDHYTGSSDLTKRFLALFDAISHKVSAVVSFGNPYAVREYPEVPRIILGYEGGYCEKAAFKVLCGEIEATGKIPVSINSINKNKEGKK
ncbi:MAG: hypothetical protein B6241_04815 [Spirochaetaceae bacterium 4572_59]|nr:MAG: hypothetical protein B6241_04815 [Spirochaetaceae bacterium 4572_59]